MSNITVIDSCCGAGKTQMMIKMINDNQSNNYLYITPFLNEVERIKKCTEYGNNVTRFKEPVNTGKGKMSSLISLLTDNCDVASTHMLFHNCSEDIIDYCVANTEILDKRVSDKYYLENAVQVLPAEEDVENLRKYNIELVTGEFIEEVNNYVRHDSVGICECLLNIANI